MVTAAGPPGIGRETAQRLARRELSKPIYHPSPSLAARIWHAVTQWLSNLYNTASKAPGGWWAVVALAAIVVIVAAGVLAWVGPVGRSHRDRRALTPSGRARTAREHRQDAQRLAADGDFAGAIRESLRAVAAELDERGVLPSRPGWTADEFAREAGRVVPAHAAALRAGAALFDEVCYGGRPGAAQGYQQLRELDAAVSAGAPRVRAVGQGRTPAGAGWRAS